MTASASRASAPRRPAPRGAQILSPRFFQDDEAFVAALRAGRVDAQAELYRRYHARVTAVVRRVLGPSGDHRDLVQEVFVNALASAPAFRGDATALEPWIVRISVYSVRRHIRRRVLWRRFFSEGDEPPAPAASTATPEQVQRLRHAYAVFEKLPVNERVPLALQMIDEMTLPEIADACGVSTTTIKRRLARARERFAALAARDPVLRGSGEGGFR